jgi:hypothetical protein
MRFRIASSSTFPSIALIALIALVSVLANQMAGAAASHAHVHALGAPDVVLEPGQGVPTAPSDSQHDPRHCDGCSSRTEHELRGMRAVRAGPEWTRAGAHRLSARPDVLLLDRLAEGGCEARGPPHSI